MKKSLTAKDASAEHLENVFRGFSLQVAYSTAARRLVTAAAHRPSHHRRMSCPIVSHSFVGSRLQKWYPLFFERRESYNRGTSTMQKHVSIAGTTPTIYPTINRNSDRDVINPLETTTWCALSPFKSTKERVTPNLPTTQPPSLVVGSPFPTHSNTTFALLSTSNSYANVKYKSYNLNPATDSYSKMKFSSSVNASTMGVESV